MLWLIRALWIRNKLKVTLQNIHNVVHKHSFDLAPLAIAATLFPLVYIFHILYLLFDNRLYLHLSFYSITVIELSLMIHFIILVFNQLKRYSWNPRLSSEQT